MPDEERAAFIEKHFLGENKGKNYDHEDVMNEFTGNHAPKDGGRPSKEEVEAMMKEQDVNGDDKVGINEADKGLLALGMPDEERAAFIEKHFLGENKGKNYKHEEVVAAMDADTNVDATDADNQAQ